MSPLATIISVTLEEVFTKSAVDLKDVLREEAEDRLLTARQTREEFGLTGYQSRQLKFKIPYVQGEIDAHPRFRVKHLRTFIESMERKPQKRTD